MVINKIYFIGEGVRLLLREKFKFKILLKEIFIEFVCDKLYKKNYYLIFYILFFKHLKKIFSVVCRNKIHLFIIKKYFFYKLLNNSFYFKLS